MSGLRLNTMRSPECQCASALLHRSPSLSPYVLPYVSPAPSPRCERRRTSASGTPPSPRCGWAWGTPYAGVEALHGIDELGFLPSDAMLHEAMSWRAMVAPIRATTGINTKLLVGLELGIPLVVSSAAAAPLGIGRIGSGARGGNGSFAPASTAHPLPLAALLADEPSEVVAACARLLSSDHVWHASSKAALDAFEHMAANDPAGHDMKALLAAACAAGVPWHPEGVGRQAGGDGGKGTSSPAPPPLCAVVDEAAVMCS